jgi:hypothetical protein
VWIVVLTVAPVLVYAVWTFNQLAVLSKRADAAWSDVDVQFKRRWELVPAPIDGLSQRSESSRLWLIERRVFGVVRRPWIRRGSRWVLVNLHWL